MSAATAWTGLCAMACRPAAVMTWPGMTGVVVVSASVAVVPPPTPANPARHRNWIDLPVTGTD